MKLTTKQIVTIMTAVAAFDLAIGTGQVKVTANMIPAAYIDAVKDWATFLAIVLTGAASVVNALSDASAQTKAAVAAAFVALFVVFMPGDAHAQGQKFVSPLKAATGSFNATATQAAPAPDKCPLIFDPLKLCGLLTGNIQDDLQRVSKRLRLTLGDDIDYAMAKAAAAGTPSSKVRLQCLTAIKGAHDQFAGAAIKKSDGSDWVRPDPAAITAVEDMAELFDNLSPQGVLLTSCAGAAKLAGMTALQVVNAFITGAATIAAAPAGL